MGNISSKTTFIGVGAIVVVAGLVYHRHIVASKVLGLRQSWSVGLGYGPHPTVREQDAAMNEALACVTFERVQSVVSRLGLKLVRLEFLPEQSEAGPPRLFNNNANFRIRVDKQKSGISEPDSEQEDLLLQIPNTHTWQGGIRQHAKVATMHLLFQQGIPLVPQVLDFALDSAASPLGCRYLITQWIPGVPMHTVWSSLSSETRADVQRQVRDWLRRVSQVPVPNSPCYPLGNASFRIILDPSSDLPRIHSIVPDGPNTEDGLPIGPAPGFRDVVGQILQYSIWALRNDVSPTRSLDDAARNARRTLADRLEPLVPLLETIKADTAPQHSGITHNDLHPGNIMFDPLTNMVTGVVDWENATVGLRDRDLLEILDLDTEEQTNQAEQGGDRPIERLRQLFPNGELEELVDVEGISSRIWWRQLTAKLMDLHFYLASWFGGEPDPERRCEIGDSYANDAVRILNEWLDREQSSILPAFNHLSS